ncbi:bifunctional salicylyl-CoA 5-hydroxylase/oxidoreductase [Streptomyces stelliscabiei]|uniref:bifunctional salicylyl-CoA 5-hydroxylase/oxidoreductase n=1 Tax=Streptomyces stelliscabiei TaxID=146820 RepID=UPI0029BD4BC7|nr:bifunctional salicylyl-CoA 5-hydroxylase/oxidoreductase [Streptomyces stelliscabiei]MDX2550722.1 bifunctional salicylyl-CoA 5-hydroxylase/oxidoreductase [Streptomyces stelliscabiei]MDX2616895.1 bifunctional salicylyl-CoA 5-hydroxylase/oxidoreductase [Streptomyces stelliscabiei]MDX2635891.1 bifunctional salicylyl-CoA 5-hydroxylase/oxidoreductase [Streptomyces stelliscabiei]MDX2665643.1 bifunctional salicylyl-CoA 5-hydroxylase/oxidoreductase [Streptomyces stelliscabiei]MDX2718198.1 bifunction
MRIAIVGGGPGGLYFAALMKQLDPAHEVTVWERNAPDDTFGFGVVFSDETLGGIDDADETVHAAMESRFARWTDIDIEFHGHRFTVGGQGFAAMSRKELLQILQRRAADLDVTVHYRTEAPDVDELRASHDLVLAADGLNSAVRTKYADVFRPSLDTRRNKYIWLGTDLVFEAFQFFVKETRWGTMQIHGYPFSDSGSTFIVEMHEDVWRRAGFDRTADQVFPPGVSDDHAVARIGEIFADELKGHRVLTNNSKWLNFTTVRNERWYDGNVVLLGDAAHTAHFSIGSGTKLAMEDALALAACLHEHPTVAESLAAYQSERKPVVESTQRAAQASLEWFENIGMYAGQEPAQFVFNLLTRSRRITFDNLRERDGEFAALMEAEFARHQRAPAVAPAMFQPVRIGPLELKNRVIVSPMDMYSCDSGVPGDFHLVHLGSKALGGAGLVMSEMVCVSPEGRITPGCPGLWTDEQRDAWRRVTDFVHERTSGRIGLQLGHSGRKGSTRLMWEGIDQPLDAGNWEVIGPSALPYGAGCHVPREATRADLDKVVADFTGAALRGVEAGFDLIEVHAAHGYLLSSFLSPVANRRTDEYGGSLENRLRFPLEVFDAVRRAVPSAVPVTVRISATDWMPDGNTDDDAVDIARAFIEHGAAAIDVSSGQVSQEEKPAYGRSYQTPFADKIRHLVAAPAGVPVIAVGAISSYDDVNSILLAGRADVCALGRTHLYNPQWTLQAAAEQEYAGSGAQWPVQWAAGSRRPPSSRTDKISPRLSLLRAGAADDVHLRWTPASGAAST